MSSRAQKRLAIAGAVVVAVLFVAANAHLLTVALRSEPLCTAVDHATPARRAC